MREQKPGKGKLMTNQQLGKLGEDMAAEYLEQNGLVILQRNYRSHSGEIDIIAAGGKILHFVEVKTRRGSRFGPPAESVNRKKLRHMRSAAAEFLNQTRGMPGSDRVPQFDVIEIQINHIENI